MIANCTCGKEYSTEQWESLPYVGQMLKRDGWSKDVELRNCTCGSTIARPIKLSAAELLGCVKE